MRFKVSCGLLIVSIAILVVGYWIDLGRGNGERWGTRDWLHVSEEHDRSLMHHDAGLVHLLVRNHASLLNEPKHERVNPILLELLKQSVKVEPPKL